MLIRQAHESEAMELSRIALSSKAHWGYSDALLELWADDLRIDRHYIAGNAVFVGEIDGQVLGVIGLSRRPQEWELDHLWVRPSAMGRGVGAALFAHGCAHAAQAGASRLRVESDPNALGFYRRLGGTLIGEAPSKPPGRRLPVLMFKLPLCRRSAGDYL